MNKKQRSMMLILVIALIIGLGSITYAYWTANTENKISTNTTIQTGVLKLVLDDGTNKDGVLTGTIDPNNTKFTTYLSITNEGTYDTFAKLYFKGLTNTFSSDLVYSIEEVDSLPNNGSTPKIVKRIKYQVPVPSASEPSRELLADGLLIKMGTLSGNNLTPNTQYYRVTIEYLYSDTEDQSDDLGKTFYTGFDIEQGDKITENIVMIDYIEDLVELANEVNAGDSKSGKEYRLMRNLDFNEDDSYRDATETKYGDINKNGTIESIKTELTTGEGWIPIGTSNNSYNGDFNGQNYELSHLYINNSDEDITNVGLFGVVSNGKINNLGVRDENITSSVSSTIGGIVSLFNNSTMDNCYNTVTTKNDNVYNINHSLYENNVGGLIGNSINGNINITNSHNDVNITGGNRSGGIIGLSTYNTIINMSNSYNSGNVLIDGSVNSRSGGIIGSSNSETLQLNYVNNSGNIKNNNTNNLNGIWLGGLVGYGEKRIIITNSTNNGNVTNGDYIGGIIGLLESATAILDKVVNESNGVVQSSLTINKNIYSGGLISGVFGNDYKTIIINSANRAAVSATSTNSNANVRASGMTTSGQSRPPQLYIINSYNVGTIMINAANTNTNSNSATGLLYNMSTKTININNTYSNSTLTSNRSRYALLYFDNNSSNPIINNAYYNSNYSSSNNSNIGNGMSYANMINSSFVTTLNNNLSSIALPSELNGYSLSTWCTSDNGPVLDYQVPDSERSIRCPAYNN